MTSEYRAKSAYLSEAAATSYDKKRFYGKVGSGMHRLEMNAMRTLLEATNGANPVLDIASGTGRVSRILREQDRDVVAFDISQQMMAQGNPGTPVVGDAERLPFRENSFEVVTCLRFFGHLTPSARRNVITEMARVSSRYVVVAYYHRRASAVVKNAVSRLRGHKAPRYLVTQRDLEQDFAAAGLRLVKSCSTGLQVSGIVHLAEIVGKR